MRRTGVWRYECGGGDEEDRSVEVGDEEDRSVEVGDEEDRSVEV